MRESLYTSGALFFRYGSLKKVDTSFLPTETKAETPVIRESLWPKELVLDTPQGNQAVRSGDRLSISCTAPRCSKVTVFYGSSYSTLRSDCNGSYNGYLTAEAPFETVSYSSPALVCSEQFGILTVKLTPFTITSVQAEDTVSLEKIEWSDTNELHQIDFYTRTPCAVEFQTSGDVLTLEFSPCRLGVLFNDDYFASMTVEQAADITRYRLVFPDDLQKRQIQLIWSPEKITLQIRRSLPEHPTADR